MNELSSEISPFNHFLLDVGDGHKLYVEQCGNTNGQLVVFIHGRYDMVCPFDNAWLLYKELPNSTLIATIEGHASIEPETKHQLIEATDKMLAVVEG